MDNNAEIVSLIRKKMDRTISDQELYLLQKWVAEDPLHAELLRKVEDDEAVLADIKSWLTLRSGRTKESWMQAFEEKTMAKIYGSDYHATSVDRPPLRRYLPYISYAAVFLSVLGITLFLYLRQQQAEQPTVISDLAPGRNKARITLGDGRIIELREDQDGIVLGEQLQYEDGTLIHSLEGDKIVDATIFTPRGGEYQITLSDGTKVWLNAASKLKYPTSFKDDMRIVELEGEAYFEVATMTRLGKKIPFRVKTAKQEVDVLGTQFNLTAYADDENDTRTTLVEGSVLLHADGASLPLAPGEQGFIDEDGLNKKKVDVNPYIAWKDNGFVFEELELREALKMLSRWYDFDFQIEPTVKPTYLYASISRGKSLKEVLAIIESSGIRFRLERFGERNKLTIF